MPESAELVPIDEVSPLAVFQQGGLNPLLERIAEQARAHLPDVSTARGRKEIASIAAKVARSKTTLDDLGKSLVEESKRALAKIDAERKRARDFLDALKTEVRAPLTKWEQAEEARQAAIRQRIADLSAPPAGTIVELARQLALVEATPIDESWDEFIADAARTKDAAILTLREALKAAREAEERLQAEEQKRQEADALARREREERIAREAAERARVEVEAKARAEALRLEAERQVAEQARQDAERRALEAETRARLQAEAATRRENEAKAVERARREEEERRTKDEQHRADVHRAAIEALVELAGEDMRDWLAWVIRQIANGQVPGVYVAY